jgi:hypothetical protein
MASDPSDPLSLPPNRRALLGGTWERFFERLYVDPGKLLHPVWDKVDPRFDITELADSVGFDIAIDEARLWLSVERFQETVEGTRFPGRKQALARLKTWLQNEWYKR